jgi:hypothetical protein
MGASAGSSGRDQLLWILVVARGAQSELYLFFGTPAPRPNAATLLIAHWDTPNPHYAGCRPRGSTPQPTRKRKHFRFRKVGSEDHQPWNSPIEALSRGRVPRWASRCDSCTGTRNIRPANFRATSSNQQDQRGGCRRVTLATPRLPCQRQRNGGSGAAMRCRGGVRAAQGTKECRQHGVPRL